MESNALVESLEQAQREELEREAFRLAKMEDVAKYRWHVAQNFHRNDQLQPLDFKDRPYQEAIYRDSATRLVVDGSVQWGKAAANRTPVHTPRGWVAIEALEVGQEVSIPDGGTAKVTGVFPQGVVPLNVVTTVDGRSITVCDEHNWEVRERRRSPGGAYWTRPGTDIVTTAQITAMLNAGHRVFIPLPRAVDEEPKDLPLDPYLLGALLGDGELTLKNLRFTNKDPEVTEKIQAALAPHGMELFKHSCSADHNFSIRRKDGKRHGSRRPGGEYYAGPIRSELESLGLRGTKSHTQFIPEIYKHGSAEQRWELLRGLMDTDGHASGQANSYATTSERLKEDFVYVVRSLGGKAMVAYSPTNHYTNKRGERCPARPFWTIHLSFRDATPLFSLPRKKARARSAVPGLVGDYLQIKSVVRVEPGEATCIAVDHPRHLFVAQDFYSCHNTEFIIVSLAVMAAMGLRVFSISDKSEKRDRIVASRINPAFDQVPLYKSFVDSAKAKGRHSESLRQKHVGDGMINFVGANSEKDFSSFSADVAIVDEHQLCDQNNLGKIDHRMSGSPYRYKIIVGNPRGKGTEENQNLDWEYHNTDQRKWFVACPHCALPQVVDWWTHIVAEKRNKAGGILEVKPRDEQWSESSSFDMRPICLECKRPMNRLSRDGQWIPMNPGHVDHGYNLSNVYNVFTPLKKLWSMYRAAMHDPLKMTGFVNDQLGLAYSLDGVSITDQMLALSSTGELCGLQPYIFDHGTVIDWKDVA